MELREKTTFQRLLIARALELYFFSLRFNQRSCRLAQQVLGLLACQVWVARKGGGGGESTQKKTVGLTPSLGELHLSVDRCLEVTVGDHIAVKTHRKVIVIIFFLECM